MSILLITILFHSSHLQVPSPNEINFTTAPVQEKSPEATRTRETEVKAKERRDGRGAHNQETWRTQLAKKMLTCKKYIFCPCLAQNMLTVNCLCLKEQNTFRRHYCFNVLMMFVYLIKYWCSGWVLCSIKENKQLRMQILFPVPLDLL